MPTLTTGKAPIGSPDQFCMVSARKQDGAIVMVESWIRHHGGKIRKRPYDILRLPPEQVRHWICNWNGVSGYLRVPLIRLEYVLQNPDEFETGIIVALPEDARRWTISRAESLTRQASPMPSIQKELNLGP